MKLKEIILAAMIFLIPITVHSEDVTNFTDWELVICDISLCKYQWITKEFDYSMDATNFIMELPPEEAMAAKIYHEFIRIRDALPRHRWYVFYRITECECVDEN